MRAMVVIGHPAPASFNHALAEAVRGAWQEAGCKVAYRDLSAEGFDPLLTAEEARGHPSRDALVQAHIAELQSCDLMAVIHPNCWGAPPAIMKGWIDRVFAPGAAYGFAKGDDRGDVPQGLLRARAALVLNTGNTPLDREQAVFGDPLDRMWREGILRYCGVRHVRRALYGVIAASTAADRAGWLADAKVLALQMRDLAVEV